MYIYSQYVNVPLFINRRKSSKLIIRKLLSRRPKWAHLHSSKINSSILHYHDVRWSEKGMDTAQNIETWKYSIRTLYTIFRWKHTLFTMVKLHDIFLFLSFCLLCFKRHKWVSYSFRNLRVALYLFKCAFLLQVDKITFVWKGISTLPINNDIIL